MASQSKKPGDTHGDSLNADDSVIGVGWRIHPERSASSFKFFASDAERRECSDRLASRTDRSDRDRVIVKAFHAFSCRVDRGLVYEKYKTTAEEKPDAYQPFSPCFHTSANRARRIVGCTSSRWTPSHAASHRQRDTLHETRATAEKSRTTVPMALTQRLPVNRLPVRCERFCDIRFRW